MRYDLLFVRSTERQADDDGVDLEGLQVVLAQRGVRVVETFLQSPADAVVLIENEGDEPLPVEDLSTGALKVTGYLKGAPQRPQPAAFPVLLARPQSGADGAGPVEWSMVTVRSDGRAEVLYAASPGAVLDSLDVDLGVVPR